MGEDYCSCYQESVLPHLFVSSCLSPAQAARWLMLVWVRRCIFYVKDVEHQLVINLMQIFLMRCKYFLALCPGIFKPSFFFFCFCLFVFLSTVVLDSPTGASSDIWLHVQENVAKVTKVRIFRIFSLGRWSWNTQQLQIRSAAAVTLFVVEGCVRTAFVVSLSHLVC